MQAQQESSDSDGDGDSGDSSSEAGDDPVDIDDDDESHHVHFSAAVEQVLSHSIEDGLDFYTSEGLDALRDTAHATTISEQPPQDLHSFGLSLEDLQTHVASLSKAAEAARSYHHADGTDYTMSTDNQSPYVFLTDGTSDEPAITHIVRQFTLNAEQERALRIQYWHRTEHLIGPRGSQTRSNLNRVGLG